MKYFTAEIWAGWQGNEAMFKKAFQRWESNRVHYQKSLRGLTPRLGKHGRFFTHHSLHDGRLLSFAVSDWPKGKVDWRRVRPETSVKVAVLAGAKSAVIYNLAYTGVREIAVQTRNDLFGLELSRFGDWGYDELLAVGKSGFRHNILFQTGTEISLVFETFRFSRKKAAPREIKLHTII